MEKKIEDYLHLYLGCDVKSRDMGIINPWNVINPSTIELFTSGKYQLILRPLSDMTEEEAINLTKPVTIYPDSMEYETYKNSFGRICVSWGPGITQKYVPQSESAFLPEQFLYLLNQGFDLFGLIDAGLAINKTTL